ncbi:MAG TPA: AAA family ATPase [Deltaproteobacteria bacterium]|nr:AAA family ATPase [Deltaproteobacteria bacterium]
MSDEIQKIPDQEELERELSEYLSKKYGNRIRIISPANFQAPQTEEDKSERKRKKGVESIDFDLNPEELEAYLNQYVIKQDQAKAILATKICTHFKRIKYQNKIRKGRSTNTVGRIKNNIILIGPTGVGKTYIIKLIAQKIGVPFVKGDATKFSETGYVGRDVEDLVRDLVTEADDDLELAQYGIIYIDEIDKIASAPNIIGPDVSRTGVQRALLKPMEETEVDLKVPYDPVSQIQAIEYYRKTGKREKRTLNTKNILFIVSGAFNDLADIIKKRVSSQSIGFDADITSRDDDYKYLHHVRAEDLIQYGFESEFVGRLPVIAVLEPLSEDDLYEILKNPNNPIINGKKEDFRSYGIDIYFEDEALKLLAQLAYKEKTGARGLVSVIERVLLPYEKKLPSTDIQFLVVTPEVVKDPEGELERLLADPEKPELLEKYLNIKMKQKSQLRDNIYKNRESFLGNYSQIYTEGRIDIIIDQHLRTGLELEVLFEDLLNMYNQIKSFEVSFFERYGFRARFSDEAIDEIIERAVLRGVSTQEVCEEISRDFDYAFKLVADKTGQAEFLLPREAVVDPDNYVNQLIREAYNKEPHEVDHDRYST